MCGILFICPIKLFSQVQGMTCEIGKANVARFIPR